MWKSSGSHSQLSRGGFALAAEYQMTVNQGPPRQRAETSPRLIW